MEICHLEEIKCKFCEVGCNDTFKREEEDGHIEKNTQLHLVLTAKVAARTKEELQKKIKDLELRIEDQENKHRVEKQALEEKLIQQETKFMSLFKELFKCSDKSRSFEITNFRSVMNNHYFWKSPVMYTHVGGYNFFIGMINLMSNHWIKCAASMGVSSALSSFGCIDLSAAGGGSTSKGNALASTAITGMAGTASTSVTSHGTRGRCRLNAISSYSSAIASTDISSASMDISSGSSDDCYISKDTSASTAITDMAGTASTSTTSHGGITTTSTTSTNSPTFATAHVQEYLHASVYVIRGKHDDELKWPIFTTCTLEIVNQRSGDNVEVKIYTFQNKPHMQYEDVYNEDVIKSSSMKQLIRTSLLEEFSYYDTLYFRITSLYVSPPGLTRVWNRLI